jgi:ElaB/YqjD/DUF883 family membrane-anchored ribosome-binding protein
MKNNIETARTSKELLSEMQALASEAATMMSGAVSERSAEAFNTLRTRFNAAQERFGDAYAEAREKVVAGAKYTDETIRANPYRSLAVAAGIGVIIGALACGRSQSRSD